MVSDIMVEASIQWRNRRAPDEDKMRISSEMSGGHVSSLFSSAVLGTALYLVKTCDSVSKAYDGIDELFEQMKNITVRLAEYDCSSMESSLQAKVTDILSTYQEEKFQAVRKIRVHE